MIYQWKPGAHQRADAQCVGERLEQIRERHDGKLRPEDVVADARHEDSPTHALFEWNDRRAAEAYRLDQARYVIRSVVVVMEERTSPMRAFVPVVHDGDDERAYTSIQVAIREPALREQVLEAARRDLESWRRRYSEFDALVAYVQQVDIVIGMFDHATA